MFVTVCLCAYTEDSCYVLLQHNLDCVVADGLLCVVADGLLSVVADGLFQAGCCVLLQTGCCVLLQTVAVCCSIVYVVATCCCRQVAVLQDSVDGCYHWFTTSFLQPLPYLVTP